MSDPLGPVWLIGAGNMGGAMLRQWVASGIDPALITVITRRESTVPEGVRAVRASPLDAEPETIVLAVKPQQLGEVTASLADVRPTVLISVLGGVDEATLTARIPAGAVVRAMPNLPVAIGQGVTALHSSSRDTRARHVANALAEPLGMVEWIEDEAQFDAVTALSGCGPGFVFRFIAALAEAGAALGLPAEQAARLAEATVAGTGAMALSSEASPAVLADRVASPGGSTRAGLNVLDGGDALKQLLAETLAASARRCAEQAEEARVNR